MRFGFSLLRFSLLLVVALALVGCGNKDAAKVGSSKKTEKTAVKSAEKKDSGKVAKKPDDSKVSEGAGLPWLPKDQQMPTSLQDALNPLGKLSESSAAAASELPVSSPNPITPPAAKKNERPTPEQLLTVLQAAYGSAKSLKMDGYSSTKVVADGKVVVPADEGKFSYMFKRPNKVVMRAVDSEFISDGKTAYIYNKEVKRYSKTKMSDDVIKDIIRAKPGIGVMGLVMGVNYAPTLTSLKMLKDSKVGKHETYVLSMNLKKGVGVPEDVDATQTLWIGKEDFAVYKNQLVMKMKPQVPKGEKVPDHIKVPKMIVTTISSRVNNIEGNPELSNSAFRFNPPAGAKELDKQAAKPLAKEEDKPVEIVNKKAPELVYVTSDGDAKKLSELRGHVVLLDFWGLPMNEDHLPVLNKLNKKYGDKIKVVTISLNSEMKNVEKHLKEKGCSFPTYFSQSLETGNAAWEKFGVRVLPTAFVIDSSGVVKAKMAGQIPEEDFHDELKKVLGE